MTDDNITEEELERARFEEWATTNYALKLKDGTMIYRDPLTQDAYLAWQASALEERKRIAEEKARIIRVVEAAYAAMNHMGDTINNMDAVVKEDEAHFEAFDRVRELLEDLRSLS